MRPVTLFLCGDVMMGRGIDQVLPFPSSPELYEPYVKSAEEYVAMAEHANGSIPRPVSFAYIWGDALAELDRVAPAARIINLETSITTSGDWEPKGINYRMHPGNTPCLRAAKIDCCALANNHVLDWGRAGLSETIWTLRDAGIHSAGAGRNLGEAGNPAAIGIDGGSRVLVFSAATTDSGVACDWAATESRSGVFLLPDLSDATAGSVSEKVRMFRRPGDIAVLSIHWGGNWGYAIPRQQRLFAHALIDAAAVDVIHGHSSHHPKGIEVYKEKPILYGCGDFLNDYEGISGYEAFRSQIVLAYFITVDLVTGNMLKMNGTAFEAKRFQLRIVHPRDSAWVADVLTREGQALGTEVVVNAQGRLDVSWC